MNPLKSIILALSSLQADIRNRFNKAAENLPPLEQVAATQPVLAVFQDIEWAKLRLTAMDEQFSEQISGIDQMIAEMEKKAGESAISAAIADKTLLRAEDHETLITAAKETARKEVETEFRAKEQKRETIAKLRNDLVTEIGAIAAASLTDEDLTAEDSAERIKLVKDRVAKITAAGVTAESNEKVFTTLLACSADEAGEKEFSARCEILSSSKPAAPAGPQNPKGPTAPITAGGEKKKAFV